MNAARRKFEFASQRLHRTSGFGDPSNLIFDLTQPQENSRFEVRRSIPVRLLRHDEQFVKSS